MALDRIDILTQALNAAFINAYEMTQDPFPIDSALTVVPSKGRVENYPWMYPPPMMHQWKGYRQFAKAGETNYRVPNVTYDNGFEIELEDWDDAQVDGWKRMSAAMADGAKQWKTIQSMVNLAAGQSTLCYDGRGRGHRWRDSCLRGSVHRGWHGQAANVAEPGRGRLPDRCRLAGE